MMARWGLFAVALILTTMPGLRDAAAVEGRRTALVNHPPEKVWAIIGEFDAIKD
ncbi:MAG: hypothetical protein GY788_04870 [bacterium]|nr:hypothetical protein [bacterium]